MEPIEDPLAPSQCPACAARSEPGRVITVRLPKSLHERIKKVARRTSPSMNRFCVDVLSQTLSQLEQTAEPQPISE